MSQNTHEDREASALASQVLSAAGITPNASVAFSQADIDQARAEGQLTGALAVRASAAQGMADALASQILNSAGIKPANQAT
jgi:hypothetical protein